jgi:Uncharacterized conserved protein (DUF2075)
MAAWWSGSVDDFLSADPQMVEKHLAHKQALHHLGAQPQQLRSWREQLACLGAALRDLPQRTACHLILEYPLLRLGRRIDAVLLSPHAILPIEFKEKDHYDTADLIQTEDYALDLHDFHAASRAHVVIPLLVATRAAAPDNTPSLLLPGCVAPPQKTNAAALGATLATLLQQMSAGPPLDVRQWEHAAYRPVPAIIDAARTLYAGHGVEEIRTTHADATNLSRTTQAVSSAINAAQGQAAKIIVFVTGIPGAGKTLCGLDIAFGSSQSAAFLTGNPTLVHVFREALARDAASGARGALRAARQKTKSAIQPLPRFRDEYVQHAQHIPPERIVVIDEAQRCWSADYAVRATQDRPIQLTQSEPAHLLDIMARHEGHAAIICLVGNGQEIHTGEGGIAEWGNSLASRPEWRVAAAADLLHAGDPRQRLPALAALQVDNTLHLSVPVRSLRHPGVSGWVEAVLNFDIAGAAAIAQAAPLPIYLTRSLPAMRSYLRQAARGERRAGLIASSGARRLRAEGLGAELPHMDASEVAHWFLDHWPEDVRASDALEVVATEFSCQGLELDYVGLCWGGDMLPGAQEWRFRKFAGTNWNILRNPDVVAWRRNTYRVLLTRARYATVIWIPEGDASDRTRTPAEFDAVEALLRRCGATDFPPLEAAPVTAWPDLLASLQSA